MVVEVRLEDLISPCTNMMHLTLFALGFLGLFYNPLVIFIRPVLSCG
jgi:hypothetical protein